MSRKKDAARTRAIRQRMTETGERYTAAKRHLTAADPEIVDAAKLHLDLVTELRNAGWPVEDQLFYDNGQYEFYPGPASVELGRSHLLTSIRGGEDPDDDALFDLRNPPQVNVHVPHDLEGFGATWQEFSGASPAATLAGQISAMVGRCRSEAVAAIDCDDACAMCGDRYPAPHLLHPAAEPDIVVCPACAFDGDMVFAPATAYLAYEYDRLTFHDLSAPAGWTAVAALLACAAAPGLAARLTLEWAAIDSFAFPYEYWDQPGDLWIWLPPAKQRPPALAGLGPGARLQAVVAAIDTAHPDIRDRARDLQHQASDEDHDSSDETVPTGRFVDQMWPAAVAYAITFATQRAERPDTSGLWNVMGSFDELRSHLSAVLCCQLDFEDIESTLGCGIEVLAEALSIQ